MLFESLTRNLSSRFSIYSPLLNCSKVLLAFAGWVLVDGLSVLFANDLDHAMGITDLDLGTSLIVDPKLFKFGCLGDNLREKFASRL